jgi:undecaprenyl diphosphate synthase
MTREQSTEGSLLARIREEGRVPGHVAVIMDGNGRWAEERNFPRWMGHREGMKAVRRVVEGCLEVGVEHLTLFAFSKENWERPEEEVAALMALLSEYVQREKEELAERSVRVTVFGDVDRLSAGARQAVADLQATTSTGDKLSLNLAISYGARDEIVHAARRLVDLAMQGKLAPGEVTEESFAAGLFTAGRPDPDLLIRTSGELRVSNFLLWQIAYAEIHVSPVLWPDFGKADLFEAILDYQRRERRFGRVTA